MRKTIRGFTIVELLIVVAIMGILATIGLVSFARVQSDARDSQRSSRITIIAEALEKYYDKNGEYPSCTAMAAAPSTVTTTTLKGLDPNVLTAPNGTSGTNSILAACGDLSTTDAFAYVINGSKFTLKYREESTGNIISINSRRGMFTTGAPAAPAIVVTLNGSNILATITPVTCPAGTVQYGIQSRINDGTWGSYSAWSTDTTSTQTANDGVKYGYQTQARCYVDPSTISTTVTGSESTYIKSVTTPSAPTVTANTVAATTTWSWTTPSCASGTSARYQYRYTITPSGYDSGWVATASSPVAFTTSTGGQTYTVQVQTQCYNTNTTSGWSTSGSASYYRPTYTLTTIAGTGGTVSAGGTYNFGSTPTITATPSTYYSFSSWTGSTGCSGVASHTITMDANKSCTANFTIITYTLTTIAGAGGTVSAGGTYNAGTVQTITATPSTQYLFSSWTGSTGCSGVASHTITMDANKSCTASFVLDSNWLAIGTQVWAKYNLNIGTMVTGVTNQTNNAILEKYCWNNTESNCTTYGALYQWNEAMQYVTTEGAQGMCPVGSHIPSDNDWKILEMQLGMTQAQADAINWRGTDQGTQLKPGGASGLNIPTIGSRFEEVGWFGNSGTAYLWSSSQYDATYAWIRYLNLGAYPAVGRNPNPFPKADGYSVRCLRN